MVFQDKLNFFFLILQTKVTQLKKIKLKGPHSKPATNKIYQDLRHDTQLNDIQNNDKYDAILSIMTFNMIAERCYAEFRLCRLSLMLSVTY